VRTGLATWSVCAVASVAIHVAGARFLPDRPAVASEGGSAGKLSMRIGGLANSVAAEPAPSNSLKRTTAPVARPAERTATVVETRPPAVTAVRPPAAVSVSRTSETASKVRAETSKAVERSTSDSPSVSATETPRVAAPGAIALSSPAVTEAKSAETTKSAAPAETRTTPTRRTGVVEPVVTKTVRPTENSVRTVVAKPPPKTVATRRVRTPPKPTARTETGKGKAKARARASRKGARTGKTTAATRSGSGGKSRSAGDGKAVANYGGRVLAHLRRHVRYPEAARQAKRQGMVRVRFTLNARGRVLSVRIARSSGHSDLDRAALKAVRSAQPFPTFPKGIDKNSLPFTAPVRYRL